MENFWVKNYEKGVDYNIDVEKYASLVDMFDKQIKKSEDNVAFSNMGVEITYNDLDVYVEEFASYLQNVLHLTKGDRVAIMLPNILQYPVAIFGILKAGLIAVNINPLYTPRELENQLKDSGSTTILILENFANTLELVLEKTQVKNIILTSIGDLLGSIRGRFINLLLRKVKKVVPKYRLPSAVKFNDALKKGKKYNFNYVPLSLDDIALLQYTGGTTGISKGAMLTHGNVCSNMLQNYEWVKLTLADNIKNNDTKIVTPLPLYHIFSLNVNLFVSFILGAESILITNPKDISSFIKEIKKHKVNVLTGVNPLFHAMLNHEEFKTIDFSTWKIVLGGGTSVLRSVGEKWEEMTGLPLYEGYGLTECSPVVSINPMNVKHFQGNIGLPIPLTQIEIRDEDGKVLGLNKEGELFVKGPQVMKGYWNNPEETESVLKDGWIGTGDIVEINERGYIKLVDRKKDIIIVSGYNVYPNEVEDVITMHPGVLEAACIGVPNKKTGESLKVFVVKSDDNLTAAELIKFARENLVSYKVPRKIEFRNELPKTNLGKILRRVLKKESAKA